MYFPQIFNFVDKFLPWRREKELFIIVILSPIWLYTARFRIKIIFKIRKKGVSIILRGDT